MELTPIGVIHSPFQRAAGTPIQPCYAQGVEGWIEVFSPFAEGLRDLAGFERVWLLFWCDRASEAKLTVLRTVTADGRFEVAAVHGTA